MGLTNAEQTDGVKGQYRYLLTPSQLLPTAQFSRGIFTTRGANAVAPGAVNTASFRIGPSRARSGCAAPTGSWVPRRKGIGPTLDC